MRRPSFIAKLWMSLRDYVRWYGWQRSAVVAHLTAQTCACRICSDPIIPGDFVAEIDGGYAHAGWHYSLTTRHRLCVPATRGRGYWDGSSLVRWGLMQVVISRDGLLQFIPCGPNTPLLSFSTDRAIQSDPMRSPTPSVPDHPDQPSNPTPAT